MYLYLSIYIYIYIYIYLSIYLSIYTRLIYTDTQTDTHTQRQVARVETALELSSLSKCTGWKGDAHKQWRFLQVLLLLLLCYSPA